MSSKTLQAAFEVDRRRARLDAPEFREDYRRNYPVSDVVMIADVVATNVVVLAAFAYLATGICSVRPFEWLALLLKIWPRACGRAIRGHELPV